MPITSRADRLDSLAKRASLDGFSRVSSVPNTKPRASYPGFDPPSKSAQAKDKVALGFGRVASAPGPAAQEAVKLSAEDAAAQKLENMGIRVNQEGERAKMSIKQVLEQRRINDATGALVKELFSNCTPETLDDKIEQIFREFDTDNSGGLDSDEIGRAFLLVGKPLKDEDILAWLNEFDADGNGIIDVDEFSHMVRNRMGFPCAITCIPCLRGCSTTQRRAVAKPLKAVPRRMPPIKAPKRNDDANWAGEQMLPSIAERKRMMMNDIFRRDTRAADDTCINSSEGERKGNTEDDGEGKGGGGGGMFSRTSSAPGAIGAKSEREEIDEIFKIVKRKSITSRVDRQWESRSLDTALSAATGLLDQLNMFLVAHLKSVPESKLPAKIKETFQLMDLDGSGELTAQEVGEAFQRLGKPLSPADLAAYIASVDVDGNGVVDKDEFEHMTRRLLSIACQPSCHSCRLLYQRQEEHNWGANKERAIAMIEGEKEEAGAEQSRGSSDVFCRVSSSPATPAESKLAEEEALARRAAKLKAEKRSKKAQLDAATSSPTVKGAKGIKKNSSQSSLGSSPASAIGSPAIPPPSKQSPGAGDEVATETSKSPSRVTSKLHDAIAAAPRSSVPVH